MVVQSKRGKIANGFSLKNPNDDLNNLYIYVWNPQSYDLHKGHIESERKKKGNDHYGKATGWKCIGRYPIALPELYAHLIKHYGEHFDEEEVQKALRKRKEDLEKKYEQNLLKVNTQINDILHARGQAPVYIDVLRKAKRFLKQLKEDD